MKTWKDFVKPSLDYLKTLGLSPKDTVYEEVSQEDLNRVAAQGVPWTLPHWSRGRDYLDLEARWRHGFSMIHEVVFDMGDYAVAYISQNQIQSVATLTVPHVLGHSHVFQENAHQAKSGDLWSKYREAYQRYMEYEKELGYEAIEPWIELAQALSPLVSRVELEYPETDSPGYYDPFSLNRQPQGYQDPLQRRAMKKKSTADRMQGKGDPDPLRWIIQHLPLEPWQRDLLYIERELALHWYDRARTKIVHEGFATWTHRHALPKLGLPPEWYLELAKAHAAVTVPRLNNPYWLGWQTMEYIYQQSGLSGLLQTVRMYSDHGLLYKYIEDPQWYSFIYEALSGGYLYEESLQEPSYIYDFDEFYENFQRALKEQMLPRLMPKSLRISVGKSEAFSQDPQRFQILRREISNPVGLLVLTSLDPLDLVYASRVLSLLAEVLQVDVVLYHAIK